MCRPVDQNIGAIGSWLGPEFSSTISDTSCLILLENQPMDGENLLWPLM